MNPENDLYIDEILRILTVAQDERRCPRCGEQIITTRSPATLAFTCAACTGEWIIND